MSRERLITVEECLEHFGKGTLPLVLNEEAHVRALQLDAERAHQTLAADLYEAEGLDLTAGALDPCDPT